MKARFEKQLKLIDWDFRGAWTQEGIHGLHWYPGKFIPQVASNLVRLLTKPGQYVLDPFCGCGTTIVESVKLGRPVIGLENDLVGALASKVKCNLFSIQKLRRKLNIIRDGVSGDLFESSKSVVDNDRYVRLSNWFSERTLITLLKLWNIIEQKVNGEDMQFFQVCLSHVLKASCSQEKHWGWIADNVTPKTKRERDILGLFVRHCTNMIEAFERFYDHLDMTGPGSIDVLSNSSVYMHDIRYPINTNCPVDAIITSPPYPCVTDYVKAHRLSYELFEWDLHKNKQAEIGARWKRFRKGQVEEYKQDMIRTFENINPILKNKGLIGLVIDSTDRSRCVLSDPVYVDLADILRSNFGYESVVENLTRRLSGQRLLDHKGSRNYESIVILRKP